MEDCFVCVLKPVLNQQLVRRGKRIKVNQFKLLRHEITLENVK